MPAAAELYETWKPEGIGVTTGQYCFLTRAKPRSRTQERPCLVGVVESRIEGERVIQMFEGFATMVTASDGRLLVKVSVIAPCRDFLDLLEAEIRNNGNRISRSAVQKTLRAYAESDAVPDAVRSEVFLKRIRPASEMSYS